ncbi:hypothetical protein DRE_00936 [Drechslerella stenobrocha 248]|uniref:C2H2-type domain-containing protein n=1 Tax=Drechslerella stenobrocha 248 TaxID=1043628 RepID=W7HXM4_9PEZI|nr:hypothetical protein DRE_00936 [Drechslerella stenobrocha 248]
MDAAAQYWTQDYAGLASFGDNAKVRTVDIGDQKLSLPMQALSQHPIERFSAGEAALPLGLVPNLVHGYLGLNQSALSGFENSPMDQDDISWHSSGLDDDQHSLCTDSSSSSGPGCRASTGWNQEDPLLTEYQSNAIAVAFQDTEATPYFKGAQAIDPGLTLNYRESEIYGYKEAPIKFEFPLLHIEDGEFEHESCSPEAPSGTHYSAYDHGQSLFMPTDLRGFDVSNWARKIPETRSQAYHETRSRSQFNSKSSSNGSSKSSKSPRSPLSPTSRKKILRGRGSSSGSESPTRQSTRPKTYRKKVPFYVCERDDCKNIRFKNKSELKKHVETRHTKPYICICGFANCQQRFGARNEWKRHIATQHLVLYEYICDHPDCNEKSKSKPGLFNRADLFMKHQERMHSPSDISDRKPNDPAVAAWKDEMRKAKDRCEQLRSPPQRMTCGFCSEVFEKGDKTWMELIDHVGLHYQTNDEAVRDGYRDDQDLIYWMKEHGLLGHDGDDQDDMDLDGDCQSNRRSRKHSSTLSTDSSCTRQIKQEHMDS